jgi:hypothetical protein
MANVMNDAAVATLIDARPACAACGHPGSEHTGPQLICRLCGDQYEYLFCEDASAALAQISSKKTGKI